MAPQETQPFVAVVCQVPMVVEALLEPLAALAEVHAFPARNGTVGLLRSVRPDVVVVDSEEEADDVAALADELELAVVHVALHDDQVRVLDGSGWRATATTTPEAVRDAVAGAIFGRGRP